MAILNATPDSFSGDGILAESGSSKEQDIVTAIQNAERAIEAGADILDIGGMSTRPNAPVVSADEEESRVLPLLNQLKVALPQTPLSVDTYRASVAQVALEKGVILINSIWGLRRPVEEGGDENPWNQELVEVVADSDAFLVLTHNGRTAAMRGTRTFPDIVAAVRSDLEEQAEFSEQQGISRSRLIADPGLGFGKTFDNNLQLMRRLEELRSLGLPLLVGASRKSFLGKLLGDIPPAERDAGTAATTAWMIPRGADMVRVHDVYTNVMVARVTDALYRNLPNG